MATATLLGRSANHGMEVRPPWKSRFLFVANQSHCAA